MMEVKLIEHTKLSNSVRAGRTCWDSFHKGGCYTSPTDAITETDREFLSRIINKHKHGSIAEHLVYSFDIDGISRACLQELARHRIASYSVKSSRYTLKELKDEEPFIHMYVDNDGESVLSTAEGAIERACNYLVEVDGIIDLSSIYALHSISKKLKNGKANDKVKYLLPESYKTSLVMTVNARSLQNFLELRSSSAALWEIRLLAQAIYDAIPDDHKYLFKECMQQEV